GYLKVTSPAALTSRLEPVAHNGLAAPSAEMLQEVGWARPAEFSASFELTVAVASEREDVRALIERLAADERQLFRIRAVPAGTPADLEISLASERAIVDRMRASGVAETL